MTRVLNTNVHSDNAVMLAHKFSKRIVGQPEATEALTCILDKFDSGFYDRTKPIASILFLGPTGTGKTATVEAMAEGLFGSATRLFRIDCGEFQHSHDIAKLIGSPPGYLGHRETSPIISNAKIKEMQVGTIPLSILLLDEIEKASDALWNLLLGILDKGRLTLGTNEVVDMTSLVIVMTSNVGSKELAAQAGNDVIGFLTPTAITSHDEMKDTALAAARRKFTPEFMNRLDHVIMFNTLTEDDLKKILEVEIDKLRLSVVINAIVKPVIEVTPAAKAKLLLDGYEKKYGARHLKRALDREVTMPLSRVIASRQVEDLDVVVVDYLDGEFCYFMESNVDLR
jgi:ATP-dependent Clp protease ATP-binding subunit ClpA